MKRSVGALALLRLLDQPDDAGNGVVGGRRGDPDAQRGVAVDRAGEDRRRRRPCASARFRR